MDICLAGISKQKWLQEDYYNCRCMLETFYYFQDWEKPYIKNSDLFLLDSGAFTFMNSIKTKEVDFDRYTRDYVECINKYSINNFFELDIDSVVGLDKVEKLRDFIEKETGKKSIPVWHKSRGKQYFIDMCKNYGYVAIGGIVSREIKKEDYKYFKWFIDTAHSNGAKIHGLGFTSAKYLPFFNFDSVDSVSWQSGGVFWCNT